MKFFVTNDLKNDNPLSIMITALLALLTLFIFSDLLVKGSMFGWNPHAVYLTLIGDAENFLDPYAFETLLEMVHTDLFFSALLFLILAALSFRIDKESSSAKVIILILLIMLIISTITPLVAINGFYSAALLWFYSFILSHLLYLLLITHSLWVLWFKHD